MVQSSPVSKLESGIEALQKFYGALPTPPRDPFTLFVWEVLSVHSTPRKRDAALAALKRIRALTPDAMWRAPQKKLEESVALAGPYTRATAARRCAPASISSGARRICRRSFAVRCRPARRALKPLPQLGEAGAHRMLLFAADHAILPVDARVSRVGRRLGLRRAGRAISASRRARSRRRSARELPASVDVYRRAFLYLSHHGGGDVHGSDPHCAVCPLLRDCPEGAEAADG